MSSPFPGHTGGLVAPTHHSMPFNGYVVLLTALFFFAVLAWYNSLWALYIMRLIITLMQCGIFANEVRKML